MKNNKLKALLMSTAIFTGAMLDSSTLALAEDMTTNAEFLKNTGEVTQQVNEKSTPVINGIKVNKQLIDINYSKGVTISPKYIVIHDTDNRAATADAMANRNYFANHPNAKSSAHYIIDDSNIVQALEDTWKGWHVGDGGNSAAVQNGNSIGIELAVNSGNNFDKTYQTGIELTRHLMRKYNIPAQNVVMHNHASGKICSRMMIQDRPNLWEEFKSKAAVGMPGESLVNDGIAPIAKGKLINVSSYLNIRTEANAYAPVLGNVYPNKRMNIYGEENGYYKVDFMGTRKTYGYVKKEYIEILSGNIDEDTDGSTQDKVEINKDGLVSNIALGSALNVRSGPSTANSVQDRLPKDTKVKVNYETNNWYNITYGSGKIGYVSKNYITLSESGNEGSGGGTTTPETDKKTGIVYNVSNTLNVRSGAGTNHAKVGILKANASVTINYAKDGWYNIDFNGSTAFVSDDYIKIVEDTDTDGSGQVDVTPINKDGLVSNLGSVSALNVRTGPGTTNSIQDKLPLNTKVRVNHKTKNGWYNISYSGKTGFVSGDYIKIIEDSSTGGGGQTDTTPVNKDGLVANLGSVSALNVRTGPGTTNSIQDKLSLNTKVRVNYKTKNGWYNISYSGKTGFVSDDYIKLIEDGNSGSTDGGNINQNGTVINVSTSLNVRTGPSTSYSIKDKISKGKVVKVNSEKDGWYNISYDGKIGYVSKDYIKLSGSSSGGGSTGGDTITPETEKKTGSVINVSNTLNVRSGAGTNHSKVGTLNKDAKVTINYEKNGWYNINFNGSTAFVSKDYIKVDDTTVESTSQKGKIINVSTNLNVRAGRGTSYSIVGYVLGNEIITVLDHKEGWHKIEYTTSSGKKTGYVKDDFVKIL
ncbi:SH3 domain-containing protein [uncultured Clostridium sp.]|uniref:SH3 domain-containing protein n=1 Tax=uncultured Clostridium sp. TaxID=59620 RepID=UPI00260D84B9|nr:SH3 domain-containing protein [uncultured Clostridium sp.]